MGWRDSGSAFIRLLIAISLISSLLSSAGETGWPCVLLHFHFERLRVIQPVTVRIIAAKNCK